LFSFRQEIKKSSSDKSIYEFPDGDIEACVKAMFCPPTPTNLQEVD
jgi:hypothetical protein